MKKRNVFLAVVLFMMLLLIPADVSHAATQKSLAVKAYKQLLSKKTMNFNGMKVKPSRCKFAVAYVDNNSVPELFLYCSDVPLAGGTGQLYTYRSGKVRLVESFRIGDNMSYYKKKGIFINTSEERGYLYNPYYKLSGTKAVYTMRADRCQISAPALGMVKGSWTYKNASGKVLTKSQFNSQLKKLVGTTKKTKVTFRSNTSANRSKYIK